MAILEVARQPQQNCLPLRVDSVKEKKRGRRIGLQVCFGLWEGDPQSGPTAVTELLVTAWHAHLTQAQLLFGSILTKASVVLEFQSKVWETKIYRISIQKLRKFGVIYWILSQEIPPKFLNFWRLGKILLSDGFAIILTIDCCIECFA